MYRVIENEDGYFRIQKKGLWSWANARIKSCYTFSGLHGDLYGMMMGRGISFKYKSLKEAQEDLKDYFLNQPEKYRGNNIIIAYDEYNQTPTYINKSHRTKSFAKTSCYYYEYSLEELKRRIDKRMGVKKFSDYKK